MEIREMRAFVTVVDEGGLSAAARAMHISQSALSQTVRSLERQVGGQLLVRDHNGARPTELGATLLDRARALLEQHDDLMATLTRPAAPVGRLRVGVPLELPTDLLPMAIAEVSAAHPDTSVELRHARSTAQLAALRAGEIELALVRDRPTDPRLDSVLAVEEAMGVVLTASRADELAGPGGVRLHRVSGMSWVGFARSDAPVWHDQVVAILRSHGVTDIDSAGADDRPVPREVKFAAVGTGRSFALASAGWVHPLPEGLVWHPLISDPVVRLTWAVWRSDSRQRELATLVAALSVSGY
ncbi:LysR family transcriptional regulator [Streptomyces sp. NPDC006923]|uniref:LysR substrate-binding domain-containing protein n=1 Tax=Streptomyces sp. NPDC006923 TaxID=3155355 RepID=UPI0033DB8999